MSTGRNAPEASPYHQRLYKATTPADRSIASRQRRNSPVIIPSGGAGGRRSPSHGAVSSLSSRPMNNSYSRGGRRPGTADEVVPTLAYVADLTPTFCVDAAARCIEPLNDRVAWTAEFDGSLRIRSIPKGTELKEVTGREGTYCSSLLYNEAYQKMWAGFHDGYIRVYDAPTAALERETLQHTGAVYAMITLEGTVYTGGADWKICQWHPQEATFERLFYGHKGSVRCLSAYNGPTGAVLFSGSDDGNVCAWNPYAPAQTEDDVARIHTFRGHERAVLALETVAYANQLWSGGEDTTLRVWNLETLECMATLTGHDAPVSCLMVLESRMWSSDKHGHVILWDMNTLSALQDVSSRMRGVGHGIVTAMRKMQPLTSWRVWTAGSGGVIQCWNAETVPVVFDPSKTASAAGGSPNALVPESSQRKALARYDVGDLASHTAYDELERYCRSLLEELAAMRQDAEQGFERDRMEVQRELQTQQLFEEENESLRCRLRMLEEGGATEVSEGSRGRMGELEEQLRDSQHRLREAERLLTRPQQPFSRQENAVGMFGASVREQEQEQGHPSAVLSDAGRTDGGGGSDAVTTHLSRTFRGDKWAYLMEEKPHELRRVFRDEASTAFGVPVTQLTTVAFTPGDLVAQVGVRHPRRVSADEMQRRLERHPFSELMALHRDAFTTPKTGLDAAEQELMDCKEEMASMQEELDSLRRGGPTNHGKKHSNTAVSPLIPINDASLRKEMEHMSRELDHLRHENDRLLKAMERGPATAGGNPEAAELTALRHENASLKSRLAEEAEGRSRRETAALPSAAADSAKDAAEAQADLAALERHVRDHLQPIITALQLDKTQLTASEARQREEIAALRAEARVAATVNASQSAPPPVTASTDRGAEVSVLRAQVAQLRAELEKARSGSASMPVSATPRASAELESTYSTLKKVQAQLDVKDAQYKKVRRELDELQTQVQAVEQPRADPSPSADAAATAAATSKRLQDEYSALTSHVEGTLKPQMAEQQRTIAALEADLRQQRQEMQQQQVAHENSLHDKAASPLSGRPQVNPLEEVVAKQTRELEKLKADYDALMLQKSALDARTAAETPESSRLRLDLKKSQDEAARREAQATSLQEDVKKAQEEMRKARTEGNVKESQLKKLRDDVKQLREDLKKAKADLTSQEAEGKKLAAEAAKVKEGDRRLQEDVASLERYVQDELLPKLSAAERDCAEKDAEIVTLQAALDSAQDAHDANRVRSAKMAEAVEAMSVALAEETSKGDQAAAAAAAAKRESPSVSSTDSGRGTVAAVVDAAVGPTNVDQWAGRPGESTEQKGLSEENERLRERVAELVELLSKAEAFLVGLLSSMDGQRQEAGSVVEELRKQKERSDAA